MRLHIPICLLKPVRCCLSENTALNTQHSTNIVPQMDIRSNTWEWCSTGLASIFLTGWFNSITLPSCIKMHTAAIRKFYLFMSFHLTKIIKPRLFERKGMLETWKKWSVFHMLSHVRLLIFEQSTKSDISLDWWYFEQNHTLSQIDHSLHVLIPQGLQG